MSTAVEVVERLRGPYVTKEIGRSLTDQTIQTLKAKEDQRPGSVGSVIVFFERPENLAQREFLLTAELTQANRETRHAIACRTAEVAQGTVIHWLTHDVAARETFGESRLFDFIPQRDIRSLPVCNALSIPATSRLVEMLSEFDKVLTVVENIPLFDTADEVLPVTDVKLLAEQSSPGHQVGFTWGWHRLGLPSIHSTGLRGFGVCLGLVNTGASDRAADLVFKLKDFVKVQTPNLVQPSHSFDAHWHGTHLAGIMVGAANSGTQIGGAPESELKAASVLDGNTGWFSSLLAGIEWFADPYRSVSVINLSLGIRAPDPKQQLLLEDVFDRFAAVGIIAVAASGNQPDSLMYPAALANVVGVGALAPDGTVWAKSGLRPDLLAPGVSVFSCFPPGRPELGGENYGSCSGTSCAAAHVSAFLGLLIQARPRAGLRLILDAIVSTADAVDGPPDRVGRGVPNFFEAIRFIDSFAPPVTESD